MAEKKQKRRLTKRLKEEVVEIEGLDGQIQDYTVKELNGTVRDDYMKTRKENFDHDKQGNPTGIKEQARLMSNLLKFCVHSPDGALVPQDEIDSWPHSTQTALFQIAAEVNGLAKPDGAEKGGQSPKEPAGESSPAASE